MKSNARQYLDKDRDMLIWLYDGRCIRPKCRRKTNIIHEIEPISHGKKSLHWKNRVLLCSGCHEWAHSGTNTSIPILQKERIDFLVKRFGLNDKLQETEEIQTIAPDL